MTIATLRRTTTWVRTPTRRPLLRPAGWPLWSLPRPALIFVLSVQIAAVIAVAGALRATALRPHDVLVVSILTFCGLVCVEGSRQLGSPATRRDRPYKDMLSAWMLPVVLLLPPLYALLVPIPIYLYVQLRVTRIATVKRVFNAACVGLAGGCAATVHGWLAGGGSSSGPQALLGSVRAVSAAILSALVFTAISAFLVATVLRLAAPGTTVRAAFGGWAAQATEGAELCVGVLVALAAALNPALVVLALLPMLLLQRTLLYAELLQAARTDAKTGLANPRHWREVAEREVSRARRGGSPLAVLLVDLDRFKDVNDGYGHLVGDRVLIAVAQELQAAVRPRDLVGRFGGEEFVLLLADADSHIACTTAERVRARVQRLVLDGGKGRQVRVTISIGVASLGVAAADLEGLLERADAALYTAKSGGRNCVRSGLPPAVATTDAWAAEPRLAVTTGSAVTG